MGLLKLQEVQSRVAEKLGKPLDDMARGCIENAVDGYNGDRADLKEIKQSLRHAVQGLLDLGDTSLLAVVDATEEVCDAMLRDAIAELN